MSKLDDNQSKSSDEIVSASASKTEPSILSEYYFNSYADLGQLICTVLLNDNNFEHWAKHMRRSLHACFLDSECHRASVAIFYIVF